MYKVQVNITKQNGSFSVFESSRIPNSVKIYLQLQSPLNRKKKKKIHCSYIKMESQYRSGTFTIHQRTERQTKNK